MFDTQVRDAVRLIAGPWWAFLIAGLAWFVISIIVLQLNLTSVGAVGVLLGVVFLVSAVEEFFAASVTDSWAWPGAPGHPLFRRCHMVVRRPHRHVRVHRRGARVPPYLQGDARPGYLDHGPRGQLGLVARANCRAPRARSWLLGGAAIFPGPGGASLALGGLLCTVQGDLLDCLCFPGPFGGVISRPYDNSPPARFRVILAQALSKVRSSSIGQRGSG